MESNVKWKTELVVERLEQLGLNVKQLMDVVRQGHHVFISASPNDPPLAPGFSAWARMVRALREYLLPQGWSRSDENNYSVVISPDDLMMIAVATGDDKTGNPHESPTTKSSKGPSTVEAVTTNQQQMNLNFVFPDLAAPARPVEAGKERTTWILLVHRGMGEVRCELSLPTSMGTDGRIDAWRERIVLGSIPTDPDTIEILPQPSDLPDISIDIKRRA